MLLLRRPVLVGLTCGLLMFLGQAGAQTELVPGGLQISMHAGYQTYGLESYCLPVANWGLGRQAAEGGNLEWQLASNYSCVPVFVRITQRQAIAIRGRVEVVSEDPYYSVEVEQPSSMTVSQEFVAPPGRETIVALAPRVAPLARPGYPVSLTVRIFRGDEERPFHTEQLSSTQLEPAHVYSLLLDDSGRLTAPKASTINEGNHLRISLPEVLLEGQADPYQGLLTFNHYLLSVDRRSLTSLPLTARDFAFVCADAQSVASWPANEQESLCQYALAGGHLCLFNTRGGKEIPVLGELHTRPLGRGWLIGVTEGLATARGTMDSWLEGEFEEFALWMYGSVNGQRLALEQPDFQFGIGGQTGREQVMLDFVQLYGGANISHEAGYLHPIWLYREAFRAGALEPWDYPEFSAQYRLIRPATESSFRNPMGENWNISASLGNLNRLAVRPLYQLAQPPRAEINWVAHVSILLAAFGAILFGAYHPRRQLIAGACATLVALAGAASWFGLDPAAGQASRLTLIDADTNSKSCVQRILTASPISEPGAVIVETGEVIRYVRGGQAGNIELVLPATAAAKTEPSRLRLSSEGKFAAIASDRICKELPQLPIRLWATQEGIETCVHVDTSDLAEGTSAVLYSPAGVFVVPAGVADFRHWLRIPYSVEIPSAARLLAWQQHYSLPDSKQARMWRSSRQTPWDSAPQPYSVLRIALSEPQLLSQDKMSQLAWAGLLQPLSGAVNFIGDQCWVFCELPASGTGRPSFLRLTLPLAVAE